MNILHIDSCPLGDHSPSRQSTANAVAALLDAAPSARVVYRDLAAAPLSHVSGPLMQAMRGQWNRDIPMGKELRAEVLQSESLLQEFIDSDVLVLGAPLSNFSAPTTLKAWLDRLLLAGTAVNAGARADAVRGKRVLLVSMPSHVLGEEPAMMAAMESHVRTVFRHIGVSNVETFQPEQSTQLKQAA
jgi:FMN-dependent NADH-azoreductase